MTAAAGLLTRSRIEAFDQTSDVLADLAQRLRAGGSVLKQAGDAYVEQMRTPDGTEWEGDTARRFLQEAHPDRESVNWAVEHANAVADLAERGGDYGAPVGSGKFQCGRSTHYGCRRDGCDDAGALAPGQYRFRPARSPWS